jgi:uncharacterized protein YxeA
MVVLYIILVVVFLAIMSIYYIYSDTEQYNNFYLDGKSNYANDIYGIRPPYEMAKHYRPEELGPYRILKFDFLNHPIEG